MPHCRVKQLRIETSKAKSLVLNKSSVKGTLTVESKETLKQIKTHKQTNKQTNKQTKQQQEQQQNKKQKQTKERGKMRFKMVVQCKFETSYGY